MALDEPKQDEQPVQINGIDVLLADVEPILIDDTIVDYVKESYSEGFVIKTGGAC